MQNTLIIGDIHGCFYELQALLDRAGLSDGDEVIAIGDMVDRGPETPQIVDFFKTSPNARAIMGNHERKHVRGARHEVKLSISQQISKVQFGPTYSDALEWMAKLPLNIELGLAILMHGYFEPGIALEHQNPSVLCGTMGGEKILREGYDRPWYELYDAEKPVIVGHYNYTHTDQPFVYRDKVFGLDTDCVTGKCLTGILLPSFQSQPRVSKPWSEAQMQELNLLFEKLQEANHDLLERVQALPDFMDRAPRQQAKLYSELVGQGTVANLLHLARLGKLDIDKIRTIVRDPGQVSLLINRIGEISGNVPSGKGLQGSVTDQSNM